MASQLQDINRAEGRSLRSTLSTIVQECFSILTLRSALCNQVPYSNYTVITVMDIYGRAVTLFAVFDQIGSRLTRKPTLVIVIAADLSFAINGSLRVVQSECRNCTACLICPGRVLTGLFL